ncbi:MAG: GTP 3',8-cyclase MoaA, partial [Planctomycetes bacterium]|nr:GTP 3',8-cyclase MoaA [Planctomycetota bacterium]
RISVTDRCNLRCRYCMPEPNYAWLPRGDLLDFAELRTLTAAFQSLGVSQIRLTGGEPLLRRDLPRLVEMLAGLEQRDLAMTTNGALLAEHAAALRGAGLQRVTVSLDSLDAATFRRLTGRGDLAAVLAGIDAAVRHFPTPKLNCVVMRGSNDAEIPDLIAFGREHGVEVRFIEYMDVGGATEWSRATVVPRAEILNRVAGAFGAIEPVVRRDAAPADRWRLADGTVFGVIASTTAPFCGSCDRSRLTADGTWYRCLYAREGLDLRGLLRGGASLEDLRQAIASAWRVRADRGAEERAALGNRGVLADRAALQADPRLEMHTRGG